MNTLSVKKFDVDETREPQFFFTVPYVGTFGLTSFDPHFYNLSFALLMLQSVINVLAAIVIYTFIVKTEWFDIVVSDRIRYCLSSSYLSSFPDY
jgi:hypothetical protein